MGWLNQGPTTPWGAASIDGHDRREGARLVHLTLFLVCFSWVLSERQRIQAVEISDSTPKPMRASTPAGSSAVDAERRLESFIRKFGAADQRLIRAVRRSLRKRFPTANELVWDNYNFFVIGYSPTERPSDAIVSMAARANGVGLCFIRGASLPDPDKILLGSGRQTRFIRVESAERLERPEVEALIAAAIGRARARLPATERGKLIIRSVSAKQRPRRQSRRPSA